MSRTRRSRPGPQPKPLELKVLEGNPGRRPLGDVPSAEKPVGLPSAPDGLATAGQAAWARYWRGGSAWLSLGDYDAIWRACKLIDRAAAIETAIDAEGFLVVNRRTKRSAVHAAFNNLLGVYRAIADLETAAGLPATERSRIRAEKHDGDEIDRWMAGAGS